MVKRYTPTDIYMAETRGHADVPKGLVSGADYDALAKRLEEELDAYRKGGVTEEILRRNDGHIKLAKGCTIVREEERITWTTVKPTKEGHYWLQCDSEFAEVVCVYEHHDSGLCVLSETVKNLCERLQQEYQVIRWSSEPIGEPEEAS